MSQPAHLMELVDNKREYSFLPSALKSAIVAFKKQKSHRKRTIESKWEQACEAQFALVSKLLVERREAYRRGDPLEG